MEIVAATAPDELEEVRRLLRSFVAWHRRRHHEDLALVERYFDAAAFAAELAGLPGAYAPPRGRLLLARDDGRAVGCVALRPLGGGVCEMKRMFVDPACRGRGAGRALAEAVLREAGTVGYRTMRLDTSVRQAEAQALYRSLGFVEIPPDADLPADLAAWLVFFERRL